MDISERLSKFIDEHTDEMVADTMKLCAVNSEKGAYEEGKPYGEGPFKALNEAMDNLSGEPEEPAFTGLLESSYPKPRAVTYYADKLSITAKYLSVVCKKACGKSASKIIDAYVSKDIEHLLRNSRKSIKEISNELDFPNTSFFGRYVKKYFGCTPVELRRKLNGVDVIRNA